MTKTTSNKNVVRRWSKTKAPIVLVVHRLDQLLWQFLKTPKIHLPYVLLVPLLNTYPKERKSAYQRDSCTLLYYSSIYNNSQGTELASSSSAERETETQRDGEMERWRGEYYSSLKINKIPSFATQWNGNEGIKLIEISQA